MEAVDPYKRARFCNSFRAAVQDISERISASRQWELDYASRFMSRRGPGTYNCLVQGSGAYPQHPCKELPDRIP